MRTLVELTKITEGELPPIYCDMDQVICDFIGGYEKLTGLDFARSDKDERWNAITGKKDFWATLDWMPGSQRMWSLINKYNANILSAYSNRDGNSRNGKKKWLSKNATTGGKPNILIDDYIKNIKEWENAGGIGIHHLSPTQTIAQLKRYGFR
jgi:hypothetical protein